MKLKYDKENEQFVVTESTRIEYHQLELWLTRHVKGWKYNPAVKAGVWDGKMTFFKNGRFNMGLWKEAINGLKEVGANVHIENKEDFPLNREVTLESVQQFVDEFFKDHRFRKKDGSWEKFTPYEHQVQAAFKILKNRYCLAEVATSGGKTLIISLVYFYILKNINPDAKLLIITPSISLVTQFYDELIDFNLGHNVKHDGGNKNPVDLRIEEVMSDKPRKHSRDEDPNVYIGTYQSLEKWPKEFFHQFYVVAVDESHKSQSGTITKILKRTFKKAQYRFGVSGTFPTEETCEILTIQSVLGPKITEVSADELRAKGIITPMDIKAVILNHNNQEFNDKISQIRKISGKDAHLIEKDFIHRSEQRLDFISKIVQKCNGNVLVLFHTIEYGQKLIDKLSKEMPDRDFHYIDGEVSGKKREGIKSEMEKSEENMKVLIGSYGCLSTGVSIRYITHIVFADSFKSEQIVIQSIGRGLRLHEKKDKLVVFDLVDVFNSQNFNNILYSHFKERTKFYIKRKYPYKIIKVNL
jgi:superfamily II DNA or RNA helicase